VCLLRYAYATSEYSSRGIERHCRQDVAYRVITGNRVPDHATIARFVRRHQDPLAGLFTAVLELCAKAGLVRAGIVIVDGTKLSGNANRDTNVDYGQIAQEAIARAIATDEAQDQEHRDARGDELPDELSTDGGPRAWLAREIAAEREPVADPARGMGHAPGERSTIRGRHAPLRERRVLIAARGSELEGRNAGNAVRRVGIHVFVAARTGERKL